MKNWLCGIFIPQLGQENSKLKKPIESLSILIILCLQKDPGLLDAS